jgi:hypothetical protein
MDILPRRRMFYRCNFGSIPENDDNMVRWFEFHMVYTDFQCGWSNQIAGVKQVVLFAGEGGDTDCKSARTFLERRASGPLWAILYRWGKTKAHVNARGGKPKERHRRI